MAISRVFSAWFCILCFFECWCFLLTRISLKTAGFAATLGSLCRDRLGVHHHLGRAACRVPCVTRGCAVSRVDVQCVM